MTTYLYLHGVLVNYGSRDDMLYTAKNLQTYWELSLVEIGNGI